MAKLTSKDIDAALGDKEEQPEPEPQEDQPKKLPLPDEEIEQPEPEPEPDETDPEDVNKGYSVDSIAGIPIRPVSESESFLNTLIYAESGTGKTILAGSASAVPEMAPALLIDIEGGTLSLRDFYPDVRVVRVKNWTELQKVYDRLYSGREPYKTVIVDSLTEAQKFSMTEIMAKAVREDRDIDPDVPQQRHWGQNISQMRRFTRALRDLPVNVIYTALANIDKEEISGRQITRPSFNGKLAGEIPAFMDTVLFYYIKEQGEEQHRLLLTKKTGRHLAKDRSNRLPPIIENPTMELLYGYMSGKITPPPAPEPKRSAKDKRSK